MHRHFLSAAIDRFRHIDHPPGNPSRDAQIGSWLDQQIGRCSDPSFASLFADHIDLPGVAPQDYLHQIIEVPGGHLLGGIRFYAQDITRPYVEILAWTGPPNPAAWRDAIASHWAMFAPSQCRVLDTGEPQFANGTIDQTVHSGRTSAMAQRPRDSRVTLVPCPDTTIAAARVADWYGAFAGHDPATAAEITPADAEALAACQAAGTLDFICLDGEIAGLLATEIGTIDWLHGHVMIEEILAPAYRGQGLAAKAQTHVAARLDQVGQAELIIGTIHRVNTASRRTATRAGRPCVMAYRFFAL